MTSIRTTLATLCLAAAALAATPTAQALDLGIVKKFANVSIPTPNANFSKLATARWWCMNRGFAKETTYQFDYLQSLGEGYGYSANYKQITCIRGVHS